MGLASVLHHILKPVRSLPVWADGICINEDDMDEKSDQVSLMSEIYRLCSQVNVWLPAPGMLITSSSPERDAPSLGALMGRLGGDHFHDLPGYSVDTQTGKLAFEETEEFRALWETHDLLASSLWWTRAWTAQEVFLPPRVVFFHHAAKPCQISVINRWFSRMWAQTINPKPCCQDAMDIFPPEKLGALWGLFNRFTKIQDRRSMPRRDSDDRDCFYVLLKKFAERECQQGRDRIYSLWSATDASYHHLAPDYTKTDDDVYTSVFESMIQEAQSHERDIQGSGMDCRVFMTPGLSDCVGGANSRPSWVPDLGKSWGHHGTEAHVDRLVYSRLYQASGWTSGRATVDGRRLYLRGFRICKIRAVGTGPIDYSSLQSMKRAFAEWMEIMKQCGVLMDDNHDQFYKELAAVLCAEVHHCRMSKEEWTAWKQRFVLRARKTSRVSDKKLRHEIRSRASANSQLWRRYEPGDSPAHGDLEQFLNPGNLSYLRYPNYRLAVAHSISQRAFYLTEDKRMGLCLPHARVGDEVWGVHGANVPFIFRSFEEQGETRSFSMVGD